MARPPIADTQRLVPASVRLPPKLFDALDQEARRTGQTLADVIRTYVVKGFVKSKTDPAEDSSKM